MMPFSSTGKTFDFIIGAINSKTVEPSRAAVPTPLESGVAEATSEASPADSGQVPQIHVRRHVAPRNRKEVSELIAQVSVAMSGIGDGYDQLSAIVSSLDRCGSSGMPQCSGTHVGVGIESALAQFTDEGYEASSSSSGQAIVIVGDGNPNPNSSMQPYDGSCGGDCNEADLKRIAIELADAADEAGISIYTVFYDEANNDDAAAFFESLARGKGKSLRTPDSADLPQMLTEVCTSFSQKLVD